MNTLETMEKRQFRDVITGRQLYIDPLNKKNWDSFEVECYMCDYYSQVQ